MTAKGCFDVKFFKKLYKYFLNLQIKLGINAICLANMSNFPKSNFVLNYSLNF